MKELYKLNNINLNYQLNGNDIRVLKNINFEIKKNERVALIGESGSGKTSLLMLMSGLENPSSGSIIFENKDFSKISEEQKTAIRKKKNWISVSTVLPDSKLYSSRKYNVPNANK